MKPPRDLVFDDLARELKERHVVPVLIGAGRALFGALPKDTSLELISSRSFPSGMVQSTYRLVA